MISFHGMNFELVRKTPQIGDIVTVRNVKTKSWNTGKVTKVFPAVCEVSFTRVSLDNTRVQWTERAHVATIYTQVK